VFDTADVSQEAQAFLEVNTNHKSVSPIDKYRAGLVGNDPAAQLVRSETRRLGIGITANASAPKQSAAIAWMRKAAVKDPQALSAVLSCAAEMCHDRPIPQVLLGGLFYIHTTVNPLTDRRLRIRLLDIGAERLLDAIARAASFFKKGGEKVYANAMLDLVNKGLRNKFGADSADE
jgi:hypothetical protein